MSEFTPEQVERAAEVLRGWHFVEHIPGVGEHLELSPQAARFLAEKVLSAAGAPEKVTPVVAEVGEVPQWLLDAEHQRRMGESK